MTKTRLSALLAVVFLLVSGQALAADFKVDDSVLKEFKEYLAAQSVTYTPEDFNTNLDWVKASIRSKIVTIQFGQAQGLRTLADWDPQIQKALTFLPQAQALEDNAHKVLTQKAEAREN